jgi:hypothetical protein
MSRSSLPSKVAYERLSVDALEGGVGRAQLGELRVLLQWGTAFSQDVTESTARTEPDFASRFARPHHRTFLERLRILDISIASGAKERPKAIMDTILGAL